MRASLETLFLMLQNADIYVGAEEIVRLSQIFALEPDLDHDGLRRVLMSTIVKSVEERAIFERVYDKWFSGIEGELRQVMDLPGPAAAVAIADQSAAVAEHEGRDVGGDAAAVAADADWLDGESRDQDGDADGRTLDLTARARIAPGIASGAEAGQAAAIGVDQDRIQESPGRGLAAEVTKRSGRAVWLGVAIVFLAIVGVVFVILDVSEKHESEHPQGYADARAQGTRESESDAGPVSVYNQVASLAMTTPEIVISEQPRPERGVLGWLLAPVALILLAWMWIRFGRGTWLPEADGEPVVPDPFSGLTRQVSGERRTLETLMLDQRDEEELVWGVGRFVSEEPGRELDIERTVRATASAYGRPVLVYEGSRYQREVWLWIDESLDTPMARQLVDDLVLMLESSGLPVMRATFWGLPERVRTSGDEVITLDAFDSRRDGVAVAILTDGRMMSLAHRARNRRGQVNKLLRTLSYWPRVTFIDFGDDRLEPLCRDHGLRVIRPQDAASAISDFTEPYERPARYDALVGDARVWAAVCSLSPHPVSDRMALALRRELGLEVSPWMVERIRERARAAAGGTDFSIEQRISLLGWLLAAEQVSDRPGRIPRTSLLWRAAAAWERVLDRHTLSLERESYRSGQSLATRATVHELAFIRAAILLWTEPDRAARSLFRLHRSGDDQQKRAIERYLGYLGPRDHSGSGAVITLPWARARLRRETRVLLDQIGFGGATAGSENGTSMPAPGRLWLAVGLCLGLAFGALGAMAKQRWFTDEPDPVIVERGDRPVRAYMKRERLSEAIWRTEVGTPWSRPQRELVERGGKLTVSWEPTTIPCVEVREGAILRRCTRDDAHPEPMTGERAFWSFAIILNRYPGKAEKVALELLQSGSADGVYIVDSPDAMGDIPLVELARPPGQAEGEDAWDQLLVVADEAPAHLDRYHGRVVVIAADNVAALIGMTDDFDGRHSLAEQVPNLQPIQGDLEDFRVFGTGLCGAEGLRCCPRPRTGCTSGLRCENDVCVATECMDGEPDRCAGENVLEVCQDNVWIQQPCAPGEICDAAARVCRALTCAEMCGPDQNCVAGACVSKRCSSKKKFRCEPGGTTYRRCDVDSGDWGRAARCPAGSLCTSDMPCRPIEDATVEFLEVKHDTASEYSDAWRYKLACAIRNSGGAGSFEFKLDTSDASVSLPQNSTKLSYENSPRGIVVSCSIGDIRPGGDATSVRIRDIGKLAASATHRWDTGAEGQHQLDLSGVAKRPAGKLMVRYRIQLVLGFPDLDALGQDEDQSALTDSAGQ